MRSINRLITWIFSSTLARPVHAFAHSAGHHIVMSTVSYAGPGEFKPRL